MSKISKTIKEKWYYTIPVIGFTAIYILLSPMSKDFTKERHEFREMRETKIHEGIKYYLKYDTNKDSSLDKTELRGLVRKELGYSS